MSNIELCPFNPFPLPSLVEQKKIVAYLDSLSAKARALQQEAKSDFSSLRQSVLQQAFDGQAILPQAFSGQ